MKTLERCVKILTYFFRSPSDHFWCWMRGAKEWRSDAKLPGWREIDVLAGCMAWENFSPLDFQVFVQKARV